MNPSLLIYKKMNDVMKEVKAVTKDQKNTAQGFKFRGIDQFINALYPALTKHGVFMTPECVKETHELKDVTRSNGKAGVDKHVSIMMNYTFYAEDGSWVRAGPVPAEGLDSGDKATNKALSAALKYALIQTFSIPTEDMVEADLDSPEIGTNKVATLKAAPPLTVTVPNVQTEPSGTLEGQTLAATIALSGTAQLAPAKISTFRKPKTAPVSTPTAEQTKSDGWT